jgi:16S rRNA (guanine(527)-N(7))-methyltransferase RsmG
VFVDILQERLAGICELTPAQAEQLHQHYELLNRWNQTLNLSSVQEEAEAVERHYCESIFLAAHLPQGTLRIADIGSGAGFPGFPVAVLRPDCSVTLIESHQRKAVFLRESSRQLTNVRILAKRAEDIKQTFDWCISRAVRYGDIQKTLRRLAPHAALLTGDVHPDEFPGFTWQDPILLPWGIHRFLLVSRETVP